MAAMTRERSPRRGGGRGSAPGTYPAQQRPTPTPARGEEDNTCDICIKKMKRPEAPSCSCELLLELDRSRCVPGWLESHGAGERRGPGLVRTLPLPQVREAHGPGLPATAGVVQVSNVPQGSYYADEAVQVNRQTHHSGLERISWCCAPARSMPGAAVM